MTVIIWGTVALLATAALLGLVQVMTAPNDASRAVVGDLIYFCAVGIFIMIALEYESVVIFDVASVAALLGILATIALSRILTRGRR
ncbi:monovalent cation/H+ antiporter complex subunit F [Ornithinicoccus halotolerans]|uniref:monovalent cation/H+ antiporter complex subunit F n=1 Tax=Ornithinicoccus halotolerans TaxID=1748220 RepID=UPI001295815E|nr:monovalent cation/H+ antiporter complex subunit F [Ornithinicoccus halotolerans]